MIAATELRLVLVTPETTLLDQQVRSLQYPLYDGQMGVLPGRAPLVGRLGVGELRFEASDGGTQRYLVDGGFVQIKGSVVTLLTHQSLPIEQIDLAQAEADLTTALAEVPNSPEAFEAKQQALQRARRMIALRR